MKNIVAGENDDVAIGLVGRAREVEALHGLCAAAVRGAGAAALLLGEAGVGKTALVEVLARYAAGAGIPVLVGRAVSDDGAPAFWPWRRVLEEAARGGVAGLPVSLLDLRRSLGDAAETEPVEAVRFRAMESTARALVSAADLAGLVVVLEDLQWADESSVWLLRHVCGEVSGARLLVVGTVRDPDRGRSLPEPLTELIGLPAVHTMRLGPLSTVDIAAYLRQRVDRFDRSWPGQLRRLVGGNPLLVRELTQLLIRQGRLAGTAGGIEVPTEIRRLAGHRMAYLSVECRSLLGGCAAISEEIDVWLLHATVGGDVESLLAEAVAAGVLVDDPHSPATLCFTHDLFRQACYGELSRVQRIDWHRCIAEALTAAGPGEARVGELARHRVRAAVDASSRCIAAQACQEAGAVAVRRLDFTSATQWYGQALDLLDDGSPARRAQVLLARAQARYLDGKVTTALEDCARAADIAERLHRPDLAAEAALVVRGFLWPGSPLIAALCERARVVLGDEDSARHAQVLAQHAFVLVELLKLDEADQVSRRAMTMAERSDDAAALAWALHARHEVIGAPDSVAERLALGARMRELTGRSGRPETELWGLLWRIEAALQLGSMKVLDADIAALADVVDRFGWPVGRWHLLRAKASRALIMGQFAEARRHAVAAQEVAGCLQDFGAGHMFASFMTSLLHYTGGMGEILARLPIEATLPAQYLPITAAWPGKAHVDAGDYDQAWVLLNRLQPWLADLPRDGRWLPTVALGGDLAAALGDRDTAEVCYRLLEPCAGLYHNNMSACYGSVDRVLGELASVREQHDLADRHLAAAVAMEQRIGALPALAEARFSHARALVARGAPGDSDRALELADRALRSARRLGMAPIANAASALVDELTGVSGGAAALTGREREIAGLVAQGLTNKVIAERLVVSERTVETHVRNLLGKLGLTNRTQVAAWAGRTGLRSTSQY